MQTLLKINFITLFPQFIESYFREGVVGQACKNQLLDLKIINPRDYATDQHKSVDDKLFGGGDGMLMMVEPLQKAVESLAEERRGRVIVLSPQGRKWHNSLAKEWADRREPLTLICGRYAGIDQRFVEVFADEEISVGDFILSGGELAALCLIDSVARFIPGVLGDEQSPHAESFHNNQLECPQFTRPRHALGLSVPSILLSGHHQKIEKFRQQVSLLRTFSLRPDLMADIEKKQIMMAAQELGQLPDEELMALGFARPQLMSLREALA